MIWVHGLVEGTKRLLGHGLTSTTQAISGLQLSQSRVGEIRGYYQS